MTNRPEKQEILKRIENLYNALNKNSADWDAAFIAGRINQYYFTGTMQDGIFILKNDGTYIFCVRNSFERAKAESPLDYIYPMTGYREAANIAGSEIHSVYIETEIMSYAMLERLKKYFKIEQIIPADKIVFKTRAVKSRYELACMEESGRGQEQLFRNIIPGLLKEGISEAEFTALVYKEMVKSGHYGVTRFAMFQAEQVVGQVCFGENSLYPTNFDGPGGMKGMSPSVPTLGDRNRLLKKGDLVFADIGYNINGYQTDRTQVYMFGKTPPAEVEKIHRQCLLIQKTAANLLKPGGIPGEIYSAVINSLDNDFLENFMGFGGRRVKFLGHGVGLHIDEYPVISDGFTEPLEENMTIAIEPKKGIPGVGMAGVEDTYIVTENGGSCITGGEKDIIVV
ncbi:MAG: Xaa-Pro peptidase family protein [Oscillospiraceae bacterium]|nr:Xaa-Pro peptidase family protein [Oscillospiraceae bacterium]